MPIPRPTPHDQPQLPPGFTGGSGIAYTRSVQPNELTETHLSRLLSGNSPYVRNARNRGTEFAQSRLLGNSSIAAGASERAAIETALPVAQDASGVYGLAAGQNQDALNRYEIADRGNASAERRATTAANAQVTSARIAAETARANLEATLSFQGQQADLDRAHQIFMGNMAFDQNLQAAAFQHGIDLDRIAANAFYDLQQVAAFDNLNTRDQGMAFVLGSYNNYSGMVQDALMGDYDAAAQDRLITSANNYLSNSIAFGQELFSSFPEFDFTFSTYGPGG